VLNDLRAARVPRKSTRCAPSASPAPAPTKNGWGPWKPEDWTSDSGVQNEAAGRRRGTGRQPAEIAGTYQP